MIFNTKRHKLEFPFYIGAHIFQNKTVCHLLSLIVSLTTVDRLALF